MADVVTVESVAVLTKLVQGLFDRDSDGGLAAARESGEPDGAALLVKQLGAGLAVNVAFVPSDIGRSWVGHDDGG